MPKRLRAEGHVETGELERLYRESRDAVERGQYRIVWLLSQGGLTLEVMDATGYSGVWIRELARRYDAGGPGALGDRRRRNPGAADWALRDGAGQAQFRDALRGEAPDGGLWNGRKAAEWMAGKLGRFLDETSLASFSAETFCTCCYMAFPERVPVTDATLWCIPIQSGMAPGRVP